MDKQYVFIDDSGDPGLSKSKTEHFIIAAVLLLGDNKKQQLDSAINSYRKKLGWNPLHEFKFHTTKKDIIIDLINFIEPLKFSAYAMVLDKTKITPRNMPKDKSSLYYYIIKELLLKLELTNPIITIDGRAGKQYSREINTYLRQHLKQQGVKRIRIYLTDSRKNSLVQLADIVAGAVARSYRKDKTGARAFRKALGDKIVQIHEINL